MGHTHRCGYIDIQVLLTIVTSTWRLGTVGSSPASPCIDHHSKFLRAIRSIHPAGTSNEMENLRNILLSKSLLPNDASLHIQLRNRVVELRPPDVYLQTHTRQSNNKRPRRLHSAVRVLWTPLFLVYSERKIKSS